MLRIQPGPVAPSAPPPCCCSSSSPSPSSSSSSTSSSFSLPASRRVGYSQLRLCAVNCRNGSAAARRWQSCRWNCSSFSVTCCKASLGSGGGGGAGELPDWREPKGDNEFLQASLLVSETVRHYNLRKQGFFEETKWHSSSQIFPLSLRANGSKSDVRSIGHAFLRRFQNPTIFLKIACDGDFLLPIIVGEYAMERLIDTLRGDREEESQNQFKFIKNLVGSLGHEVKMVRITKRVINTYYARIFLGKSAEMATLSVDSRPSDAIHLAIRCQAPIYVSKDIVLRDAIQIAYGTWRGSGVKTVYDVSLDSASEGPDVLSEELDLIRKMNMAVIEERYDDAAVWRDKLAKLRVHRHEL